MAEFDCTFHKKLKYTYTTREMKSRTNVYDEENKLNKTYILRH